MEKPTIYLTGWAPLGGFAVAIFRSCETVGIAKQLNKTPSN